MFQNRKIKTFIEVLTSFLIIGGAIYYIEKPKTQAVAQKPKPVNTQTITAESQKSPDASGYQPAEYPPHNKVVEDQDQLPEADQAKAKFVQKMAYAYQNIKTLKGMETIITKRNNQTFKTSVEFQIREGKYPASHEIVDRSNGKKLEQISDNYFQWIRTDGKEEVTPVATRDPEFEPFQQPFKSKDSNGIPSYAFPDDPAWSMFTGDIVAPLRNFPFLVDLELWSFKGDTIILGRKAKLVEGKLPSYNAKKMKSETYKVWVDDETGMVLKKEFYDKQVNVVESYEVTALQVNPTLDKKIFEIPQEVKERVKKIDK